jgi:hypothetical protein
MPEICPAWRRITRNELRVLLFLCTEFISTPRTAENVKRSTDLLRWLVVPLKDE